MAKRSGGAVEFSFPVLGVDRANGFSHQPPGTTPDCLNVVPFDPAKGRGRGGQRAGLFAVAGFAVGLPVQLLLQPNTTVTHQPGLQSFNGTGASQENQLGQGYPVGSHAAFNALQTATAPSPPAAAPGTRYWTARYDSASIWNTVLSTAGTSDATDATGVGQGSANLYTFNNSTVRVTAATGRTKWTARRMAQDAAYNTQRDCLRQITFNADAAATGTGNRVYLIQGLDGAPSSSSANRAVAFVMLDQKTMEIWTRTGSGAVLQKTIDLLGQFSVLFPDAITPARFAGTTSLTVARLYQYTDASSNVLCYHMAKVQVTVGGQSYSWTLLDTDNATPITISLQDGLNVVAPGWAFGVDLNAAGQSVDFWTFADAEPAAFTWVNRAVMQRDLRTVSVVGGTVYQGVLTAQSQSVNGLNLYNPFQQLVGDYGPGAAYIVDGTTTKKLDITTNTVSDLTAAVGRGTVPAGCRLAVVWRDRLLLANQAGSEQNVYASRQGDYTDWLYGQPDAQSAWSLNTTGTAGHVGQPVYALAPINDDVCVIGCDSSTFVFRGDPGAGGSVDLVSNQIGVLGQNAWCTDPKGIMYFVGTGGFFRYRPAMRGAAGEQAMENLSQKRYAQFFQSIDRTVSNVIVRWDRDRHGCWIFIGTQDGVTQGTHLWWDERTEGFFPVQLPANCGPTAALSYDDDQPTNRGVIVGGNDGTLRIFRDTQFSDDGQAISSYAVLGPVWLADPFTQAIVEGMEFWLGADGGYTVNLAYSLNTGGTLEAAYDAPVNTASGTFTAGGRQQKIRSRVRGTGAVLIVSNSTLNTSWSFDKAAVQVQPGGQNR